MKQTQANTTQCQQETTDGAQNAVCRNQEKVWQCRMSERRFIGRTRIHCPSMLQCLNAICSFSASADEALNADSNPRKCVWNSKTAASSPRDRNGMAKCGWILTIKTTIRVRNLEKVQPDSATFATRHCVRCQSVPSASFCGSMLSLRDLIVANFSCE
jgi:hypothetical protein